MSKENKRKLKTAAKLREAVLNACVTASYMTGYTDSELETLALELEEYIEADDARAVAAFFTRLAEVADEVNARDVELITLGLTP
jgi:hypothetical protein